MTRRYSRTEAFGGIGPEGQKRIGKSRAAFVGVGAVGSVAAEIAVRSGFGSVSLIDRDVVDETNLQRQFLFDEEDARLASPKAHAAAEKLARMNSGVDLRPVVEDLDFRNAASLLLGHDLIVDGSDNFETRLLVSDAGKRFGIPTIYAACVGGEGLVAVSTPDPERPCLRCYLGALPAGGTSPTCETAGVVPALPPLVASLAMAEALRIAVGKPPSRGVLTLSVWEGDISPVRAFASAKPTVMCDVCGGRRYPALEGEGASEAVKLCGRNSVQVAAPGRSRPDLERIARDWAAIGSVQRSAHVLSVPVEDVTLTLFSDGRCIVRGTDDLVRARDLYSKYVAG
ncbi:MAG: ThiF family adenylyltransferase [Thermoanaerobaculia bacterium]